MGPRPTIYDILGPNVNPVPYFSIMLIAGGLMGMLVNAIFKDSNWQPQLSIPPKYAWPIVFVGVVLGIFYYMNVYLI